ncbi:MAG: type II secretion system protein GspD, partial [Thermomonas sp.]
MNLRPSPIALISALIISLLAACASIPSPQVRHADRLPGTQARRIQNEPLPDVMGNNGPRPVIRRGSSAPINQAAASAPPPSLGSSGQARFNFEGESLHAVVKAILGDMLGQSYSIAPGV